MRTLQILTAITVLLLSNPAYAQMSQGETANSEMRASMQTNNDGLLLAHQPELTAALAAGGEPIVAKVLGAVCDFCAIAMNKTFKKHGDVAAVYVDLDAKTLSLVLKPGTSMDDKTLRKAVKKSGYKVDSIARGSAVLSTQ